MKKRFQIILFSGAVCMIIAFFTAQAAPAGSENKTQPIAADGKEEPSSATIERLSVFEEPVRPPYTDPFFPRTKRLPYRKESDKTAVNAEPQKVGIDQIVLKGVSGPVGRRLALINNYTFAAGESGAVKTPKGTLRIEVLEVKERSAIIKVEKDPEPKEIHLRPEP